MPIKQHRVNVTNQTDWISLEILDAIKTRDRQRPLGNMDEHKIWRNKVISSIKRAKRDINPSLKIIKIYKISQEVGAGKGLRIHSTIGLIKSEDSHTEGPNEIANEFNEFFL